MGRSKRCEDGREARGRRTVIRGEARQGGSRLLLDSRPAPAAAPEAQKSLGSCCFDREGYKVKARYLLPTCTCGWRHCR